MIIEVIKQTITINQFHKAIFCRLARFLFYIRISSIDGYDAIASMSLFSVDPFEEPLWLPGLGCEM